MAREPMPSDEDLPRCSTCFQRIVDLNYRIVPGVGWAHRDCAKAAAGKA